MIGSSIVHGLASLPTVVDFCPETRFEDGTHKVHYQNVRATIIDNAAEKGCLRVEYAQGIREVNLNNMIAAQQDQGSGCGAADTSMPGSFLGKNSDEDISRKSVTAVIGSLCMGILLEEGGCGKEQTMEL